MNEYNEQQFIIDCEKFINKIQIINTIMATVIDMAKIEKTTTDLFINNRSIHKQHVTAFQFA